MASNSGKTVIALRGTTGSGKTGLVRALEGGMTHLLDVPLLREAMEGGFRFVEVGEMTGALKRDGSVWPVMEAALAEVDYVVVEPCVTYPALVAEVPEDVRLVNCYVVAPPWMVAARRRTRYIMDGRATPANIVNFWNYTRWQFNHATEAEVAARAGDGGETLLVDTTDYPLRAVSVAEAQALVSAPWRKPDFAEVGEPQYQQQVHVSAVWFGRGDAHRRQFEQARLDAVLPERMDGMTVLDIGAMEGGFCFESLNRGATYCVAVDILESAMACLKHIRTCQWQPVTCACVDVETEALPTLNDLYDERRYSLGLLLNVLHRVGDPGAVLAKVLAVCDAAVVEAPFWMGDEPVHPEGALYEGTWHLPPLWVKTQAQKAGFVVEGIVSGPYCAEQRLIYKLRREATG